MTRVRAAAAYKRIDIESAVASADKHELITLLFKALIGALAIISNAMIAHTSCASAGTGTVGGSAVMAALVAVDEAGAGRDWRRWRW